MTLITGAVPAGLAVGFAAWLAAGGASSAGETLDTLENALNRPVKQGSIARRETLSYLAELTSTPLLMLTTGPGAIKAPAVQLDGVSLSPRRRAALIAVDGAAAFWMTQGQSSGGVTLVEVLPGEITVETELGRSKVALGQRVGPPAAEITAQQATFKSPPPPNSAVATP